MEVEYAALWPSRVVFGWTSSLRSHAQKNGDISVEAVKKLSQSHQAMVVYNQLMSEWSAELARHENKADASFFRPLWAVLKGEVIAVFIYGSLHAVLNLVLPVSVPYFIAALNKANRAECDDATLPTSEKVGCGRNWEAFMWAGIVAVSLILSTIMVCHVYATFYRGVIRLRAGLTTAVYSKIARVEMAAANPPSAAAGKGKQRKAKVGGNNAINAAALNTLFSQDIEQMVNMIHLVAPWAFIPLSTLITFILLVFSVSWIAAVVAALMLVSVYVNFKQSSQFVLYVRKRMDQGLRRVRMMTDIVGGIKVVKMYAWERSYFKRILGIRDVEVKIMRSLLLRIGIVNTLVNVSPSILQAVMFAMYFGIFGPLASGQLFTALSLINNLRASLILLPLSYSVTETSYRTLCKVRDILLLPDVFHPRVLSLPPTIGTPPHYTAQRRQGRHQAALALADRLADGSDLGPSVLIDAATFGYRRDGVPTTSGAFELKDVSLALPRGGLTMVVGMVGSGKSTLLAALRDELHVREGAIALRGRVVPLPQTAWILSRTMKANLELACEHSDARYQAVLDVAQLQHDVTQLPRGDATMLGSKGANLSGGQRQRIAIARAVYASGVPSDYGTGGALLQVPGGAYYAGDVDGGVSKGGRGGAGVSGDDLIIADDPLSAVDVHVAEALMQEVVRGWWRRATRVISLNQLQYLAYADAIVLVSGGTARVVTMDDPALRDFAAAHEANVKQTEGLAAHLASPTPSHGDLAALADAPTDPVGDRDAGAITATATAIALAAATGARAVTPAVDASVIKLGPVDPDASDDDDSDSDAGCDAEAAAVMAMVAGAAAGAGVSLASIDPTADRAVARTSARSRVSTDAPPSSVHPSFSAATDGGARREVTMRAIESAVAVAAHAKEAARGADCDAPDLHASALATGVTVCATDIQLDAYERSARPQSAVSAGEKPADPPQPPASPPVTNAVELASFEPAGGGDVSTRTYGKFFSAMGGWLWWVTQCLLTACTVAISLGSSWWFAIWSQHAQLKADGALAPRHNDTSVTITAMAPHVSLATAPNVALFATTPSVAHRVAAALDAPLRDTAAWTATPLPPAAPLALLGALASDVLTPSPALGTGGAPLLYASDVPLLYGDDGDIAWELRLPEWVYPAVTVIIILLQLLSLIARDVQWVFGALRACVTLHIGAVIGVLSVPLRYFDLLPVGAVVSRFAKNAFELDYQLPLYFNFLMVSVFTFIAIVGMAINALPLLAIPIVILLLLVLLCLRAYSNAAVPFRRLYDASQGPVLTAAGEMIDGAPLVRSMLAESFFLQTFAKDVDSAHVAFLAERFLFEWLRLRALGLTAALVGCSLLFFAAFPTALSVDVAGLITSYFVFLITITQPIVFMFTQTRLAMVSVDRLEGLTKLPREAAASPLVGAVHPVGTRLWPTGEVVTALSVPLVHRAVGCFLARAWASGMDMRGWMRAVDTPPPTGDWVRDGSLELRAVTSSYSNVLPNVLRGISFAIRPGEKIGVVGRTGSGKSSLLLTLLRMVPTGGTMVIGGVDVSGVSLADYRSGVGIIPQEPVLFGGTLRSNLDPFGRHTDDEILQAIRSSNLDATLRRMRASAGGNGLDARVEDGGGNISVGEAQLVCLARAVLRRPKILLLDEATASVDVATDAIIHQTIQREFAETTVITIAHRLHTILHADRVLVVRDGLVAEFGPPSELLSTPGSEFRAMAECLVATNASAAEYQRTNE